MTRKLQLKKDTLTALNAREMAGVVGGGDGAGYPTQDCSFPINQCLLSVGAECQYTDYPGCSGLNSAICP